MKYLYLCMSFFVFTSIFAQSIDTVSIKKRAILIAHVEEYNFAVEGNLDDIFSKYEVSFLKQEGFYSHNNIFLSIKKTNKDGGCEYILAYDGAFFYRLKGFKTSDFNIFYQHMYINLVSPYPTKKKRKKLYIENFDLETNYNLYYKKSKLREFDPTSCGKIIIIY